MLLASHLPLAPALYTDAMKDNDRAAWGWCTADGRWDYGTYGTSARRRPIHELEGDAVRRAVESIGETARGHRLPVYIDNSAFQLSLKKGWSRARRITDILRDLFRISATYDCMLIPIWISTHDNIGADALSRGDIPRYMEWARTHARSRPLAAVGGH